MSYKRDLGQYNGDHRRCLSNVSADQPALDEDRRTALVGDCMSDLGWMLLWDTAPPEPQRQLELVLEDLPHVVTRESVKSRVNVRAEPSLRSAIIGQLSVGRFAELIEEVDGWYRVRLADRSEGFVDQRFTQLDP